jgi:hypothetical protein
MFRFFRFLQISLAYHYGKDRIASRIGPLEDFGIEMGKPTPEIDYSPTMGLMGQNNTNHPIPPSAYRSTVVPRQIYLGDPRNAEAISN